MTGLAFVANQLYAVTDTGGLFRIANFSGGTFSRNSGYNVADYVDNSRELLAAVNPVLALDPTGQQIETTAPIRFSGLVAGPQNTEDGRYANLLFGIANNGRVFAFDTWGNPQPVFANGSYYVDTGIGGANGLAFSNLDDTLWHTTDLRDRDAGHGTDLQETFDGSRIDYAQAGNQSFYFGYEDDQVQSQFGTQTFSPRHSDPHLRLPRRSPRQSAQQSVQPRELHAGRQTDPVLQLLFGDRGRTYPRNFVGIAR
jgi:hypothetical protein